MRQVQIEESGRAFISARKLETAFYIEEEKTLREDAERFELLRLVKRAGKHLGFTPRMVVLLEHYIMLTFDQDWKQGKRPIVFQSQAKTAFALGVTERQIQKLENALANVGAITWKHSSNYKRFGYRNRETRELAEAYGVDLTPLLSLKAILMRSLAREQERQEEWFKLKKQISFYRGNIRKLISGLHHTEQENKQAELEERYNTINHRIITSISVTDLDTLLEAHKSFYSDVLEFYESLMQRQKKPSFLSKYTPLYELNAVHIQYTNQYKPNKLGYSSLSDIASKKTVVEGLDSKTTVTDKSEDSVSENIANITWKQLLNASSERFREKLPHDSGGLSWEAIVETAYALIPTLGISKSAWWEACAVLGRYGAAIAVIIIDVKTQETDPELKVYRPGGYLRAMVKRAEIGDLNLHKSVFGLLKRDEVKCDA